MRRVEMTQVIRAIRLRQEINKVLESIHPQFYYESSSDEAKYPFVVYSLADSVDDGSVETFTMEIDGWDRPSNGDTTELEMIMGKIDNALHRYTTGDSDLFFSFYRENRRSITDPDKRLKRRQLVFQIRVMGVNS
jgi:hypothetical protein